jgi:hypothetical protein
MCELLKRNLCLPLVLLLASCASSEKAANKKDSGQEQAVRQTFTAFQDAVKAKDGAKLWDLLAKESQGDAEQKAKEIAAAYQKATPEGKAEQEKALGLSADELAKLSAPAYLKSNRFYGANHEVPGSKIDSVSMQGDEATVSYIEEDGDKVKLSFVREGDKWKAVVKMP